ncbi:MAG: LptA/OstA family protein [Gammaproteobacteria bacterium]|nr:LptA/OstA family protein [Gammaproteobacteria bacterium]
MKPTFVLFLFCLTAPLWAQNGNGLFSITADTVRSDSDSNVTTYEGDARAEVLDLVIEAETIAIFGADGSPSRIEASGSPLRFHRRQSTDDFSGTAARIVFVLPELKLTLSDYVIRDPSGNNMKGGKATFVLDH